jgi:hypothetical protein
MKPSGVQETRSTAEISVQLVSVLILGTHKRASGRRVPGGIFSGSIRIARATQQNKSPLNRAYAPSYALTEAF